MNCSTCSPKAPAASTTSRPTPKPLAKDHYSLASDGVAGLGHHVRGVAQRHRLHTELARRGYLGPEDTDAVDSAELLRRLNAGDTVVLDVRPAPPAGLTTDCLNGA